MSQPSKTPSMILTEVYGIAIDAETARRIDASAVKFARRIVVLVTDERPVFDGFEQEEGSDGDA